MQEFWKVFEELQSQLAELATRFEVFEHYECEFDVPSILPSGGGESIAQGDTEKQCEQVSLSIASEGPKDCGLGDSVLPVDSWYDCGRTGEDLEDGEGPAGCQECQRFRIYSNESSDLASEGDCVAKHSSAHSPHLTSDGSSKGPQAHSRWSQGKGEEGETAQEGIRQENEQSEVKESCAQGGSSSTLEAKSQCVKTPPRAWVDPEDEQCPGEGISKAEAIDGVPPFPCVFVAQDKPDPQFSAFSHALADAIDMRSNEMFHVATDKFRAINDESLRTKACRMITRHYIDIFHTWPDDSAPSCDGNPEYQDPDNNSLSSVSSESVDELDSGE